MLEMKIKVPTPFESEQVQRKLFEMGYVWVVSGRDISHTKCPYLYTSSDGKIRNGTDKNCFDTDERVEISITELMRGGMKSEILERKTNKFPNLLKSKQNDVIVLFKGHREGTVVHSGNTTYDLGTYYAWWDMSEFEIYNGEVKLSNR